MGMGICKKVCLFFRLSSLQKGEITAQPAGDLHPQCSCGFPVSVEILCLKAVVFLTQDLGFGLHEKFLRKACLYFLYFLQGSLSTLSCMEPVPG